MKNTVVLILIAMCFCLSDIYAQREIIDTLNPPVLIMDNNIANSKVLINHDEIIIGKNIDTVFTIETTSGVNENYDCNKQDSDILIESYRLQIIEIEREKQSAKDNNLEYTEYDRKLAELNDLLNALITDKKKKHE